MKLFQFQSCNIFITYVFVACRISYNQKYYVKNQWIYPKLLENCLYKAKYNSYIKKNTLGYSKATAKDEVK